ncbi:MAG: hypothetical protein AAFZ65_09705, partial [Planctomycetota bacterium]
LEELRAALESAIADAGISGGDQKAKSIVFQLSQAGCFASLDGEVLQGAEASSHIDAVRPAQGSLELDKVDELARRFVIEQLSTKLSRQYRSDVPLVVDAVIALLEGEDPDPSAAAAIRSICEGSDSA